jgi:hypothetical protein
MYVNYKWLKFRYEELGSYWSISLLSNTFHNTNSDQLDVCILWLLCANYRDIFSICQLFKKCTRIDFSNRSMLETFIIKQRPDDCLTLAGLPISSLNFMERILTHMKCISWIPLVTDLTVERTLNYCKLFIKYSTPILNNFTIHICLQKIHFLTCI